MAITRPNQVSPKDDWNASVIAPNQQASEMTTVPRSVLFVGAFPRPAGLDRYASGDLALRLESRGWTTRVTSSRPGRLARPWNMLIETWRARHQYAVACVDVFSGPAFLGAEAACAVLRRLGKPYTLILRGGNLPEFSRRHPARVRRLFSSAVAVTCPSHYLVTEMRSMRTDLVLLPNPLDVARYAFHERRPLLRHLVWLRAFHETYNPELAVEVLGRIRKQYDDVRLIMIGPDKGDGSLQKTRRTAKKLGIDEAVTFPGAVPKLDVPNHLSRGDIFLNTTNCDNTPVSVMEAMACGLPVVSTNVGGIPYLVEDGESALLTPPADAEAMSNAVVRLMHEPNLARPLARTGRQRVEAFDWSVVLPRWERLLASVTPGFGAHW